MNPSVLVLTTDRQIDRRTLQQADSLEAAGWKVTVLAMPRDESFSQDDPRVVRIDPHFKTVGIKNYSLLSTYRTIRSYLPMNGRVMNFMKRFAWKYFAIQESLYLNLFSNALLQYSPDVVMAIDLPMLPVALSVVERCGAKLVYDSHELYIEQGFSESEKQRWKSIEEKYIKACDAVITVNPSIAAELEHRYHISPVNVIYNALDCTYTPTKKNYFHRIFNLPSDRKILLLQGGLSVGRNLETLIDTIAHIQNQNVDLVILGDGQLRHALEKRAIKLGIQHRIYFHPAVPQEQLLDYTQSADAGIIPYQANCLNNYYCTPNKLFEFMSAGIPILASDLPEICNIVNNHDIGLTGKMSTPKEMAMLIDKFFSSEEQLYHWKQNVLIARQQFCWTHEAKKLIQIFNAIK